MLKIYKPDGTYTSKNFHDVDENGLAVLEFTAASTGKHVINITNDSCEPLYYIIGVTESDKKLDMSTLAQLPELPVIDHTAPASGRGGTMHANAIPVVLGQYHSSYWTSSSDHLNCFNRVELPAKGELTFKIDKIYDSEGEVGSITTYIYNDRGELMWDHSSREAKSNTMDFYSYTVGLEKGIYYVNFTPDFYVKQGIFDFNYIFTFKENTYCETEANDSFLDADKLEFGHFYNATMGTRSDFAQRDFYVFPVKKNGQYRISLQNYGQIDATTIIVRFADENGKGCSKSFSGQTDSDFNNCITYEAKSDGIVYIYLYNYSGEPVKYAIKATVIYEPVTIKAGDIDQDGTISAKDARLALRASVGLEKYSATSQQFKLADVDNDQTISSKDARLILRASVGLEKLS